MFLEILRIIPISINVIIKLLPPYEKNGSVTPVTGINPTTTDKFKIVWNANWKIIPNDKNFANISLELTDILIVLKIIIKNNKETLIIPIIPNSSDIIEKIKSVCGSGI